ncbi:hypothetical protein FRC02_002796 [Tulasnella sp. 418]|nr:hypothetical protein FRC02_002796 [Tulasnella sp. 418]
MTFVNNAFTILHLLYLVFLILVLVGIEVVKISFWIIAILKALVAAKNGCLLTLKAFRAFISILTGIWTFFMGGATPTTTVATPTTPQSYSAVEEDASDEAEIEDLILTETDSESGSSEENDRDAEEEVEEMLLVSENEDDIFKVEEDQPSVPAIEIKGPSDDETGPPAPSSAPVLRRSPRGHNTQAPAPPRTRTKRAASGSASAKPAQRQSKKAEEDATSAVTKKSSRQLTPSATQRRARGASA